MLRPNRTSIIEYMQAHQGRSESSSLNPRNHSQTTQHTMKTFTNHLCAAAIVLAGILLPCLPGSAGETANMVVLAQSTFDADADGWMQDGGANNPIAAAFLSAGGTAGGCASSTARDFLSAPRKFLGDQRHAYGGILRYDLKQNKGSGWLRVWDVRLLSGGLDLGNRLSQNNPPTTWTTVEISLLETDGWVNRGASRPATREELLTVLSNLETLWIRADYASGGTAMLDNVTILGRPSGPSESVLTLQQLPVLSIDGEVSGTYRIDWRAALDAADAWTPLTSVVLPHSPYLFVDTSAAGKPGRYYRTVKVQ